MIFALFPAQLAEIRKFRYAKLLCANADFMPHIQPNVFFQPLSVVNDIVRSACQKALTLICNHWKVTCSNRGRFTCTQQPYSISFTCPYLRVRLLPFLRRGCRGHHPAQRLRVARVVYQWWDWESNLPRFQNWGLVKLFAHLRGLELLSVPFKLQKFCKGLRTRFSTEYSAPRSPIVVRRGGESSRRKGKVRMEDEKWQE